MAHEFCDNGQFFDDVQAKVLESLMVGQVDEALEQWESIQLSYEGRVDLDAILMAYSMIAERFIELEYFSRAKEYYRYIGEQLLVDEEENRWEVRQSTRERLSRVIDSGFKVAEDACSSGVWPLPELADEHQFQSQSTEDVDYVGNEKLASAAAKDLSPPPKTLPIVVQDRQRQNGFSSLLGGQPRQPSGVRPESPPSKVLRRCCSFAGPIENAAVNHPASRHEQSGKARRSSGDTVMGAAMDSKAQPIVPTNAAAGMDGIACTETKEWYRSLSNETHSFLYGSKDVFKGLLKNGDPYDSIKVAILDSGIAYTKESDQVKLDTLMQFRGRIADYRDFVDDNDENDHLEALNDQVGHGTRVAYQLTKTTPTARIYIARVARKVGEDWMPDVKAVAEAIIYAARPAANGEESEGGWGVDIINMSFGLPGIEDAIRTAIRFARSHEVLMFASTSNFGVTKPVDILYPASALEVISVDAADGLGHPLTLNPKSDADTEKTRFTAPGEGIASPISASLDRGTSFASPIAAGVAALILEFASQHPLNTSKDALEKLKRYEGMVAILKMMAKDKTGDRFRFLVPWDVLSGGYWRSSGDGQRRFIAQLIVNKLRVIFNGSVGLDTFPNDE